jgi:hypothetical protein
MAAPLREGTTMTKAKDAREGDSQAMVSAATGERSPQTRVSGLPEVPEFVPLVDSFREYMEDERARHRRRVLGLTAVFLAVLVLFAIGPIYLGRAFLRRADATFHTQEQSLKTMTASIDKSVSTLALASDELRKALELQQDLLAKVGAAEGVAPEKVAASLPPPAALPEVAKPVAPPITPAVPLPGPATNVVAAPAVAATSAVGVAAAPALPGGTPPVVSAAALPPPEIPVAVVPPTPKPVVTQPATTAVTVAVSASVTSAIPPAVALALPPELGGSTNVADLLKQIEARITALRQGNETLMKRLDGATSSTGGVGQAKSPPSGAGRKH